MDTMVTSGRIADAAACVTLDRALARQAKSSGTRLGCGCPRCGTGPQAILAGGEAFVMTTDGASRRYRDPIRPTRPVEWIACDTLAGYSNTHDDRLVMGLGVGAAR